MEIDNFDNMKKSPVIFVRYTIQMLTFIVSIYLTHLNFSIMNALWAFVLLIVSEAILEAIENSKYSKTNKDKRLFKCITSYIDKNFHFVILIVSFVVRIIWYYKLHWNYIDIEKNITVVNCLFSSIIAMVIYLISKELFSKRTAQIVSILYSIGISISSYSTVVTNHPVFATVILVAVYFLISKKVLQINNIIRNVIIGLLLGVACIIRTEGIIYIVSFVIYLFANSLIKNNNAKDKYCAILVILITFFVICITITYVFNLDYKFNIVKYFSVFDTETTIEQFEMNQKEYWNNTDYEYLGNKLNTDKIDKFDSAALLFCYINAAIFVIYCKIKNIEDERMYILYIIVLMNFFMYGFVKNNNEYSYVSKIVIYILAAGGLTIFKKNAELEAREKYGIKLISD